MTQTRPGYGLKDWYWFYTCKYCLLMNNIPTHWRFPKQIIPLFVSRFYIIGEIQLSRLKWSSVPFVFINSVHLNNIKLLLPNVYSVVEIKLLFSNTKLADAVLFCGQDHMILSAYREEDSLLRSHEIWKKRLPRRLGRRRLSVEVWHSTDSKLPQANFIKYPSGKRKLNII